MMKPEDSDYSGYARELLDLEKKQKEMEDSLWNTALTITRRVFLIGANFIEDKDNRGLEFDIKAL